MDVAPLGQQLREWRARRRMSQMDLALDTEISTRHLSFIETGTVLCSQLFVGVHDIFYNGDGLGHGYCVIL